MPALTPRENYLRVLEHALPERIPNVREDISDYCPLEVAERAPGDGSIAQRFGGTGFDWFGVHWTFQPQAGASTVSSGYPPLLTDVTRWESVVRFPDLDAVDWAAAARRDAPRYDPDKIGCITLLNGPFERLHSLMGMTEACCALSLEPAAVADFFAAVVEHKLRLMERLVRHYPVQLLEVHDDWGHATNSFFDPETWRKFFEPYVKKVVAFAKAKGIHLRFHCCGKVDNLVPAMVEAGIEHWSSVQTINDVRGILKRYGDRLTLTGGMDLPVLRTPGITREEMKAIVTAQVRAVCKGGALVPFAASSVPGLVEVLNEVLAEQEGFFRDPGNRLIADIP